MRILVAELDEHSSGIVRRWGSVDAKQGETRHLVTEQKPDGSLVVLVQATSLRELLPALESLVQARL